MKPVFPVSLAFFFILTGKTCLSQTARPDTGDIISGTWKGTSLCQQKNSPCHDEQVVYHFRKGKEPGWYILQANKIVNGAEEEMGALDFEYDPMAQTLTCTMKDRQNRPGVWKFFIRDDHISGTLEIEDHILYRKIEVTKQ